jgi:hypothetical protein
MYLGTLFVYAIILVVLSPVIWVAWWLLADLGSRATGSHGSLHYEPATHSHWRAA